MKAGKNDKTERSWNMWKDNGQDTTRKNNCTTWGNKPEGSGERRETKEISTKGKAIKTKQDITKQRRRILSTIVRAWHKNIPTTRSQKKKTEQFWTKIGQPKKHNGKAEWINDMTKELEGLEEGPKAEIHF